MPKLHKPTPENYKMVESMAGFGIPHLDIARVLGIDRKTLERQYRSELDTGHIKANTQVAQSLFSKAIGSGPQAVTACIFWLKVRAGWHDPNAVSEIMSKKEEAQWAAKRAGLGTEWGDDLVTTPPSNQVN